MKDKRERGWGLDSVGGGWSQWCAVGWDRGGGGGWLARCTLGYQPIADTKTEVLALPVLPPPPSFSADPISTKNPRP